MNKRAFRKFKVSKEVVEEEDCSSSRCQRTKNEQGDAKKRKTTPGKTLPPVGKNQVRDWAWGSSNWSCSERPATTRKCDGLRFHVVCGIGKLVEFGAFWRLSFKPMKRHNNLWTYRNKNRPLKGGNRHSLFFAPHFWSVDCLLWSLGLSTIVSVFVSVGVVVLKNLHGRVYERVNRQGLSDTTIVPLKITSPSLTKTSSSELVLTNCWSFSSSLDKRTVGSSFTRPVLFG